MKNNWNHPHSEEKMARGTIPIQKYLNAGQAFHWAFADHYKRMLAGAVGRHKRTETVLPRLVRAGSLVTLKYGRKLVYSVPRRTKKKIDDHFYGDDGALNKLGNHVGIEIYKVEHGLACTEGLVRFWRSNMDSTFLPEKYFRSFELGTSGVPEWGIVYPEGSVLSYEYCTEDNFYRPGHVKMKVNRYQNRLDDFERHFNCQVIFLFVLNVPRMVAENFVQTIMPTGIEFFFTDYQTFLEVPIGEQLAAPIYIWGEDGHDYPLGE